MACWLHGRRRQGPPLPCVSTAGVIALCQTLALTGGAGEGGGAPLCRLGLAANGATSAAVPAIVAAMQHCRGLQELEIGRAHV